MDDIGTFELLEVLATVVPPEPHFVIDFDHVGASLLSYWLIAKVRVAHTGVVFIESFPIVDNNIRSLNEQIDNLPHGVVLHWSEVRAWYAGTKFDLYAHAGASAHDLIEQLWNRYQPKGEPNGRH